jgi:hypothetical protein
VARLRPSTAEEMLTDLAQNHQKFVGDNGVAAFGSGDHYYSNGKTKSVFL